MTEDAQRELEQRALRNVRVLVDRMEGEQALSRRKQLKLVAWLIAGVLVVLLGTVLAIRGRGGPGPAPLDLKTIKAPEARPQGSRP